MTRIRVYAILFAFSIFAACTYENENDLYDLYNSCEDPPAVWEQEIELWMTNTCAVSGCHVNQIGGTGPLNDYQNAVKSDSIILNRISRDPSEPGYMPLGDEPLDPCNIEGFEQWIENGTPRN